MIDAVLAKVFGTKNEREIKAMQPAVTISSNMAGRGTDFLLGGNAEFHLKEGLRKA